MSVETAFLVIRHLNQSLPFRRLIRLALPVLMPKVPRTTLSDTLKLTQHNCCVYSMEPTSCRVPKQEGACVLSGHSVRCGGCSSLAAPQISHRHPRKPRSTASAAGQHFVDLYAVVRDAVHDIARTCSRAPTTAQHRGAADARPGRYPRPDRKIARSGEPGARYRWNRRCGRKGLRHGPTNVRHWRSSDRACRTTNRTGRGPTSSSSPRMARSMRSTCSSSPAEASFSSRSSRGPARCSATGSAGV
jgi:hypothetical protein